MTNTSLISLEHVTADRGGVRILHDVSLDLRRNEWLALVGANGAGKSTLVRAIAGLIPIASGSLQLPGIGSRRARSRHLAYLPQLPVMPDDMQVGEYVSLGRYPHLQPFSRLTRDDHVAIDEAIDLLSLSGYVTRRIGSLSGGERQRVALARVVAQQAQVLLLDEPTSSLDIGHRQSVHELVAMLQQRQGLTVLSVMHDLTLAAQYADRIAVMDGGCIVACGAPREVLESTQINIWFGAKVQTLVGRNGELIVAPLRSPIHSPVIARPL